jgi:predicted phage terminase large subunit-like protein
LNDPATGVKIIVMQRLHELDLTGHVLSKESSRWVHVSLPAIAERDEVVTFPVSGRVVERQPTNLLWPERLPESSLSSLKVGLGSWAFAGQYQQNPAPMEGGIIKRNWIRYYRELPEKFDLMVQSWDCTFKGDGKSGDTDFVAGQVWGKSGGKYLMLPYQVLERLDFGPTKAAIKACHAKFPRAHAILIEDKANGPAIISELQHEIGGIIAVNPEGGKLSRGQAVSPLWESESVELPDPQVFEVPWLEGFIHSVCTFPKAAHDDDFDAMTQALIYIRNRMGGGIFDFYKAGGVKAKEAENVAKGKAPRPGARIPETILTRNVQAAVTAGQNIQCSPRQWPEVKQALEDLCTEQATAEIARLACDFGN